MSLQFRTNLSPLIERSGHSGALIKCVKVFRHINGCLATKDNHDSWGMCTSSIECKTVMTVVLTIMSGMDPHTISVTWIGLVGMLGFGQSGQSRV
jgi:hypothetical protein